MFSFQYEIVCDSLMLVTNHIPAIREIRHLFLQWQFIQFNSTIHISAHSLYIHIQVSPPTLEISCPVPPWPMPELQNCRNIAYYLARCGKRITGNPTITKYLYPSVWHRIMYLLQWRLVMVTTVTSWVDIHSPSLSLSGNNDPPG